MRPRAAFVALVLAGVAALLTSRLSFDGDLARMLPDSAPEWTEANQLLERIAVVDVQGDAEDAAVFVDRLGYPVRAAPTEGDMVTVVDLLRERAACYVTDYERIEMRLRNVPERVRKLARQLQEPGAFGTWAARDPLGLGTEALRGLALFSAGFDAAQVDANGIVSADGQHRLILVRPGFPPGDTNRTRAFLDAIERAGDGLNVRHLGAHRSTLDNATAIRSDATRAAWLGTIAMLLLALFVFRRPATALLAAFPGAFGALIALGITATHRTSIPLAVVGFACVLLGITIDFAIHVLSSRRTPTRAILMGATTTATAFFCLQASVVPGLRDMGMLGAIGVLAAALFALAVLRPAQRNARLPSARALQSRGVLIVLLVALPFVAWGWTRVRFEGDPMAMSRLTPAAAQDEAEIRETWGSAVSTVHCLVRGDTREEALVRNDALNRQLGARPHASLSAILPAIATQRERIAGWRAFWTEQRIAQLGRDLEAATEDTPFRGDAFAPCLEWLRTDPQPVEASDLPRALWEDQLFESNGGTVVSTPVFDPSLTELDGDVIVINPRGMVARLGRLVGDETLHLGLLGALAVALMAAFWFGRFAPVLVVLIPLLLSTSWTIGLMGWLDIPLSLANAAFVVFLFGLAIDYGIFLVEARRRRAATGIDNVAEADSAVLLCALTTCLGFGALLTASHPVLFSIGATALLGIASSLLMVQALVPRLWRPQGGGTSVAELYRHQGPMIRAYAASKAKRDPIVAALCEMPRAHSVLIAGCGHGIMAAARLLRYPDETITAIDADPHKLEVAAGALRQFPNARCVCGDIRTAEFGPHDLVTIVDVLHYLDATEQEQVARRLVDVLEPGGRLLFRDGCTDSPGHRRVARSERIALATRFTRTQSGLHFRTLSGWSTLMQSCGLEVEATESSADSNVILLCRKPSS